MTRLIRMVLAVEFAVLAEHGECVNLIYETVTYYMYVPLDKSA